MEGHVTDKKKKERSLKMLALARESRQKFNKQFIGQITEVLWESEVGPYSGIYSGLTDNYIRLYTYSHQPINNQIISTRLIKKYKQGLWGELAR